MRNNPFIVALALAVAGCGSPGDHNTAPAAPPPAPAVAAPPPAAAPPPMTTAFDPVLEAQLRQFVGDANALVAENKTSEVDFADLMQRADQMLAQRHGQNTPQIANILALKAQLYAEVLNAPEKAVAALEQIKAQFPGTPEAKGADENIAMLNHHIRAMKIQAQLQPGTAFPAFHARDMDGNELSVASRHGKILLIDFWATWCPPCRADLPYVKKTYDEYHDKGFEIIGVSLDEDKTKLADFTREQGMAWPQYYDGLKWANRLVDQYGVEGIPATFLLDGNGIIIGRDLHGGELEDAVSKAVASR